MPRLSQLPINVRAQSIADLPDPDTVADLIDQAAKAGAARLPDLLADDLAELDVWIVDRGATVWIGTDVLAVIPPREDPEP